eukprot:6823630-Karenia_brevis.AAC.1
MGLTIRRCLTIRRPTPLEGWPSATVPEWHGQPLLLLLPTVPTLRSSRTMRAKGRASCQRSECASAPTQGSST